MIKKINNFWNKHRLEILVILSLSFMILYYLFGGTVRKGTYSPFFFYPGASLNKKRKFNLPKESKGEKKCKEVLERLFAKPFNKIRPDFLKNVVTGKNLEMDCYNDELKLCVEYSGKQHYVYTPGIHKNYEAFMNQKYRDEIKKKLCQENGIKFIEVPYTVKEGEIEEFLKKELREKNFIQT